MKSRHVIPRLLLGTSILAAGAALQPALAYQPSSDYDLFYVGAGYSQNSLDVEKGDSYDLGTLGINLGVKPSPYFAAELRLSTGVADDSAGLVEVDQKDTYSIFLKPQLPVADRFHVYGLLGYTTTKFDVSSSIDSEEVSKDDVSYGIGAQVDVVDNVAVSLDYSRLIDDSEVTLDGIRLGVNFTF